MLTDDDIHGILDSWSFWSKPIPPSVPRQLAWECHLHPDLITVIQGVRRCGKSTLLQQLVSSKNINPKTAVFANFEDPRLSNYLDHTLLEQIYQLSCSTRSGALTFFFDEIQNVSNWQKWLSTQLQKQSKHRFVVTGSNSQLLSGELASTLTGRHLCHELFPFDLFEFRASIKSGSIKSFLKRGGFPAALKFPEPDKLLQQYFQDIVERDIRERVSAKSRRPLLSMAQMVFESIGSELSLRRVAGASHLSPETVSLYLQACEDAYLLFSCPFFAYSEAKRQRRNKKYYAIDTALRRAVCSKTGEDLGKDFENLVYLTLRRQTSEIYYWTGKKGEVDFVVATSNGITPLQVTVGEPKTRHEEAIQEFYENFPQANEAIYVTLNSFEHFAELAL